MKHLLQKSKYLAMLLLLLSFSFRGMAQLSEGFESWPPADWTNNDGWSQSTTNHNGSNSASHYSSSSVTDAKLITPKLEVDGSTNLTFWHYGTGTIQVKYSTDQSTWTDIGSSVSLSYSWNQTTIDLSSLSGNYYFAISISKDSYSTGYIDDVAGPPVYVNPNAEMKLSFDSDFSTIQAGTGPTQANMVIQNVGGSDMDVTGISTNAPFSATYNGTIASGGSQTVAVDFDPSSTGQFNETITVNYTGTVDGVNTIEASAAAYASDAQTESFETSVPPADWSSTGFSQNTSYAYDGTNSAYNSYNSTNYISTPKLDIGSNDIFVFYAYVTSSGKEITVSHSTNNTDWNTLTTETINATNEWIEVVVPVGSINGQQYLKVEASTYTYLDNFILPPNYVATTPFVNLSLAKNFAYIEENTEDTAKLYIANEGVGDMTVSDITVPTPFSTNFSGNITVTEGTKDSVNVFFSPSSSGSFSENLTVTIQETYDGNNSITLEASAYPQGSLYESFEGDFLPFGWDDPNGKAWSQSTSSAYDGSASASASSGKKIITPLLEITSGDIIEFYARGSFSGGNVTAYYSSDKQNWTEINSKNVTTSWQNISIDLSSAAGTNYIALESNTYWYLDKVIGPMMNQDPILTLSLGSDFQFLEAGEADTKALTIQNNGFGDITIDNLTIPAPFTGSFSGTIASGESQTIDVNFEPNSAGNYSETLTVNSSQSFQGDQSISLTASAYPASYIYEDFEDETSGNIPAGWTETDENSSYSWNVSTFAGYSGSNSIYRGSGNYTSTMYSPELDMSSGDHYVYFYWKQNATTGNDLVIKFSTDGGNTFNEVKRLSGGTGNTWKFASVNLGTPNSDQCIVAFEYTNASGYVSIYLDDLYHANFPTITASGSGDWSAVLGNTSPMSNIVIPDGEELTVPATKAEDTCNNLTLKSGAKLKVEGTLNIMGDLFINSDNTGSGSIIGASNITLKGSAEIQQHLATNNQTWNWHYVAAPITDATAAIFPGVDHDSNAGTDKVLASEWDETNQQWVNITNASTTLSTGKGYAIPVNSASTVTYKGSGLVSGTQTSSSLGFNAGTHEGFHLIGNPFVADFDASKLSGTNWTEDVWVRNDGNFETYNVAGSTGSLSNGLIPAMQGFWVRVNSGGGDITLDPANLTHNAVTTYKTKDNQKLHFEVSNGELTDEMVVYFNRNATNQFEIYDTEKRFAENEAYPQIFTLADGKPVAINGRAPREDKQTVLPVGFKTNKSGSFNISATNISAFDASTNVYLQDTKNEEIIDLRENNNYSFSSGTTNSTSRFNIIIGEMTEATDIEMANASGTVSIYAHKRKVYIQTQQAINGTLTVYDVSGKLVMKKQVNYPKGTHTFDLNRPQGVYFVKINGSNQPVTEKIMLR